MANNYPKFLANTFKSYLVIFDNNSIKYSSSSLLEYFKITNLLDSNFWKTIYTYVHEEDIPKIVDQIIKLKTNDFKNGTIRFTYRILYQNNLIHIQCLLSAIEEKGKILYTALNTDITEALKEKEDELHYEQERFNALSSEVPVGVWQTNLEGEIVYANSQFLNIFQSSLESVIGKPITSFIQQKEYHKIKDEFEKAYFPTHGEYPSGGFRCWAVTENKQDIFIHFKYTPLINGRFRGLVGTVADKTHKYVLQEALDQIKPLACPERVK